MSAAKPASAKAPVSLVIGQTEADHWGDEFRPIDWSLTRRLLKYMWRYPVLQRRIIWFAVCIAAIHTMVPAAMTEAIRVTIEKPETWKKWTGLDPVWGLAAGAVVVALLGVAYHLVMGARIRAVASHAEAVVYDIRHDIAAHVQRLDMAYFDRTKIGRILSRGTSDVGAVRDAVAEVIPRTLIHGLMLIGLFAVMATYDWVLALLILALAPPLALGNHIFQKRMSMAFRAVQESFSRVTANLAETVSGIAVTQAFAREKVNARLFRDLCLRHRAKNMRAAKVHGLYIPLFETASQVVAVMILVVGGWRVSHGHMDVADLLGLLLCTGGFFMSVVILAELYSTTLQAMAGAERIFALLDTQPRIVDAPGAIAMPRTGAGMDVRFEDVAFAYIADRPVLAGISFEAAPGEVVALVGHTGSGKTSIVSLLARLYAHQSGAIRIDGHPIDHWTLDSVHGQIALVLQDNFLFEGTVAENIRFARPEATDAEVREVCARLECLDILDRLPEGLDTAVGERGSNLSSGERQLVCFARAMVADPRLLMLDEATSAVDTFTEHRIQIALNKLMEGRTSIVVAHRLSTVRRADRIVVLEHGRIVEVGPHRDLIATGGVYAGLYEEFVRLSVGE